MDETGQAAAGARFGWRTLALQGVVVTVALTLLAAAPARFGPMVVVPIGSEPAKPWLDRLPGVSYVGLGRIGGSLIVEGDRNRLIGPALSHRAILLPALPMLCQPKA
jgi:hypothetical protein